MYDRLDAGAQRRQQLTTVLPTLRSSVQRVRITLHIYALQEVIHSTQQMRGMNYSSQAYSRLLAYKYEIVTLEYIADSLASPMQ